MQEQLWERQASFQLQYNNSLIPTIWGWLHKSCSSIPLYLGSYLSLNHKLLCLPFLLQPKSILAFLLSQLHRLTPPWGSHLSLLHMTKPSQLTFPHLTTYWSTTKLPWMDLFLVLSFLILPLIHLNIVISITHSMYMLFVDCPTFCSI